MPCIFEGCDRTGRHTFGVRLRRPGDVTAVWARNTNALVCDYHAGRGMRITIELESTDETLIETTVRSTAGRAVRRMTVMNEPAVEEPE